MILVIDNYDSFTYNLVQYLSELNPDDIRVFRNDRITVDEIAALAPERIVISPGPCTPKEAGICLALIKAAGDKIPMFGVCLGHQAIGDAFGGDVIRAPLPIHGKLSTIHHDARQVFRGINGPLQGTRYHSLIVDQTTLPDSLEVTASTEDGLIMGLSHKTLPIHGVQFHPESILSEHGHQIFKNFLDLAADWNSKHPHFSPSIKA